MNMTSLLVRTLMLAVFATGVIAVAAFNNDERAAAPVTHALAARTASDVVELPTVSVRPTAAEIADAMREDSAFQVAHAISTSHTRISRAASSTLPSLGLDMPYYSFGKALPRVSKE
jgi:hypothetical protein